MKFYTSEFPQREREGGGGGGGCVCVLRTALIQFASLSLLAVSHHLILSLLEPLPSLFGGGDSLVVRAPDS